MPTRPAPGLIAAALCLAVFAGLHLVGAQDRLRVVLVHTRGTDPIWTYAASLGLEHTYGEQVAVELPRWTVDLEGVPQREGSLGPQAPIAAVFARIPEVPRRPLVALICDVDLSRGGDPATSWIHGSGLPDGRVVFSVRRTAEQYPDHSESLPRVAWHVSHEFGHLLGFGHTRDGSVMQYVAPGQDPGELSTMLSREDRWELPIRTLVRRWVPPGSPLPLAPLIFPLLALPGLAVMLVAWHALTARFGSARVQVGDLAVAGSLHLFGVALSHHGWACLLAALALLQAVAARLMPRVGGVRTGVLTVLGGIGAGIIGMLVDAGFLTGRGTLDPLAIDPEIAVTGPALVITALALRSVCSEPLEGRAAWGRGWPLVLAPLLPAAVAAWLSSPSAALGAAAVTGMALRVGSVHALRIDLPGRARRG